MTAFQVGAFNSTGKRFKGHYSIWLTNEVQELLSSLEHCLIDPILLTGWLSRNFYERTNEVEKLDDLVQYKEPQTSSVGRPSSEVVLLMANNLKSLHWEAMINEFLCHVLSLS